jgi:hypothetical protein
VEPRPRAFHLDQDRGRDPSPGTATGSARPAAVTWGRIADIAYHRGDYEQAADLQRKRLEVNRHLGDLDGIAAASRDLARIDLARQDHESALLRMTGRSRSSARSVVRGGRPKSAAGVV